MNIKKTTLYNLHKKHGAKFVNFAGYEMPIQYKSGIITEHNMTRNKSGIFDVSHMGQLFIKDKDDLIFVKEPGPNVIAIISIFSFLGIMLGVATLIIEKSFSLHAAFSIII